MSLRRWSAFVTLAVALPVAASALTDNIDLPFRDDPAIVGRWRSVDFVHSVEDFTPHSAPEGKDFFLKELTFQPHGKTPNPIHSWTKGVLINVADHTAGKYLIKRLDGVEYLFVEWKTGDYVLRDAKPDYYVLVRDSGVSKSVPAVEKASPTLSFLDCLFAVPLAGICKHPLPGRWSPKSLDVLPRYDSGSAVLWQVDLRGRDVSGLSLTGRQNDLLYATFDSQTKFPRNLPKDFSPERILELGKNPGLGIRTLHGRGVTGTGVPIAIIDQNLLVDHVEYAGRIRSYEELHWVGDWQQASMHAGAVSSIAVGKRCGVAPDATVYYIADWFGDDAKALNYTFLAAAIDRVLAFNKSLSEGERIRVVTIERGFTSHEKGYTDILAAIERAKKAGVFVITSSLADTHGFKFNGLGRMPMADPDDPNSYAPGLFWKSDFLAGRELVDTLLVPMDSRTTAGPTSSHDYVFYRDGGWSWAIPYIAGLYALACQVRPDVTPELFWETALKTGDSIALDASGKKLRLGQIVAPRRLIEALEAGRTR